MEPADAETLALPDVPEVRVELRSTRRSRIKSAVGAGKARAERAVLAQGRALVAEKVRVAGLEAAIQAQRLRLECKAAEEAAYEAAKVDSDEVFTLKAELE